MDIARSDVSAVDLKLSTLDLRPNLLLHLETAACIHRRQVTALLLLNHRTDTHFILPVAPVEVHIPAHLHGDRKGRTLNHGFYAPCLRRRYLRGGFAERMLYTQILLAVVHPIWELLSPLQLLRSFVFSRYVRTQVKSNEARGTSQSNLGPHLLLTHRTGFWALV